MFLINIVQTPLARARTVSLPVPPGVKYDEDCPHRASHGERAAEALWGDRANCLLSYDELVGLGHEVTLFASADSLTAAKLVSCASMALRLDSNVRDPIPYYMLMLDRVPRLAQEI
jgi:hypothetical protein